MRFQVPQFIEIEDKVFGPLTFKQFLYLAGGAGLSFILYVFLPLLIAIPLILGVAGFSAALAFYKTDNKPFIVLVGSWFRFVLGSKLYVWKKEAKKPKMADTKKEEEPESLYVPKLSDSKLKDLSWSLDVKEFENNQQPITGDQQ